MTNVVMPGPVAWFEKTADRNWFLAYSFNPTSATKPLITTDQAEAYADARVREALEEAPRCMIMCRQSRKWRYLHISTTGHLVARC